MLCSGKGFLKVSNFDVFIDFNSIGITPKLACLIKKSILPEIAGISYFTETSLSISMPNSENHFPTRSSRKLPFGNPL